MKNFVRFILCLVTVHVFTAPAYGADDEAEIKCLKSASFFAPIEGGTDRNYPPDRAVTISHLALDMTPDFKQRTFKGREVFHFKPNGKPVQELSLDAVDLTIVSVTSTEAIQAWQSTTDKLIITFAAPIPIDKEASVTIAYSAQPTVGIYFRTPEMGYKEGDTHLFSQGEAIDARHWYPCFDAPNAKFTTELTCRVPDGMTAVSNGRLVSQEKDAATGLTAFHWAQEKPHANYLIMVAAGYFKTLEEKHNDVPLAYLTPPSEFKEAPAFFRDSKDIMGFFESEIGVPYPWAKYDQICVNDFVEGGMENTSATLLTDGDLATEEMENIVDGDSLLSHEMAHQWFGDLVTCDDWSDIWLNEGFATYYEVLYEGHRYGRDRMLYDLYQNARGITGEPNDTNAIVRRGYGNPMEMFSYLAYPKGGWVLHMLRSELGEDLYRRCIKTYLERHQYGNVVTEDLRKVIEELSGRSYDQFFDQWLYHAHHPELEANYSWDEKAKLAKISVKQVQQTGPNVLIFSFPLTIRFKGKFGTVDHQVVVEQKESAFYFPLESAPQIVRLDPDYTLLTKTTFNLPNEMLYAQLADKDDVIGRLLAIEQMKGKKDHETLAKLKEVLNNDPFYGVRVEAAGAVSSIHNDDALDALLTSTQQSDARVRRSVVAAIDSFYRDKAFAFARESTEHEKNPVILRSSVAALGKYGQPEVHDVLIKFLNSESYRNQVAEGAVDAIRSQDDPAYITQLMEALRAHEAEFHSRGFGGGLDTLAYLARNEEKKDAVREFLLRYVNDKRDRIQLAAIRSLGTLGDPKAIAVLETFASAAKGTQLQRAAEGAVAVLRAGRRPVDDFKNLRQEVTDLEKASREQGKEIEDLKKQLAAKEVAAPGKSKGKNKSAKN